MNTIRLLRAETLVALALMLLLTSCRDQIGNPPPAPPSTDGVGKIIYSNGDLLFARTPVEILLTDSSGSAPQKLFPWAVWSEPGTASSNPTVSEAYVVSGGRGRYMWVLKDTGDGPDVDVRAYVTDNAAVSSSWIATSTPGSLIGGVISPDGSRIALSCYGGVAVHPTLIVYSLAKDHDSLALIDPHVIGAEEVPYMCFSPDGSRIAYYVKTGTGSTLEFANSDGSGKRTLAMLDDTDVPDDALSIPIAWSPAGDEIAFQKSASLRVIHADGSGLKEVDAVGAMPDWSPDGKTLAYVTSLGVIDHQRIVLTSDLGSTRRDLVVRNNLPRWGPKWSPDGQKILCFTGGPRLDVAASLEVIDVAKGTTRVLASPGCFGVWLR